MKDLEQSFAWMARHGVTNMLSLHVMRHEDYPGVQIGPLAVALYDDHGRTPFRCGVAFLSKPACCYDSACEALYRAVEFGDYSGIDRRREHVDAPSPLFWLLCGLPVWRFGLRSPLATLAMNEPEH